MHSNLNRFISAQENDYQNALLEIKSGKKTSHWMWYIFPQIIGLGNSDFAKHYAIRNLAEAKEYINHPILGSHLKEISTKLLKLPTNDAFLIFGKPDNRKLQSCMTLFSEASDNVIFKKVLDKFYEGQIDQKTLDILAAEEQNPCV